MTDPEEIDSKYRYWRTRILYTSFIGYATYYFCRVNISMAIPQMQIDLGYSKSQIGLVVSALQLAYGLGKFGNGILADRANPRYFMALGLILSGVVNIFFGLSASLTVGRFSHAQPHRRLLSVERSGSARRGRPRRDGGTGRSPEHYGERGMILPRAERRRSFQYGLVSAAVDGLRRIDPGLPLLLENFRGNRDVKLHGPRWRKVDKKQDQERADRE